MLCFLQNCLAHIILKVFFFLIANSNYQFPKPQRFKVPTTTNFLHVLFPLQLLGSRKSKCSKSHRKNHNNGNNPSSQSIWESHVQLRAEDGIPIPSPEPVTDTPPVHPRTAEGWVTHRVPQKHFQGIIPVWGVPVLTGFRATSPEVTWVHHLGHQAPAITLHASGSADSSRAICTTDLIKDRSKGKKHSN